MCVASALLNDTLAKKILGKEKEKFEKIIEALDENEDVSDYYTNLAD